VLHRIEATRKFEGYETHVVSFEDPTLVIKGLENEVRPRIYFRNTLHGQLDWSFRLGLGLTYCNRGLILGNQFKPYNEQNFKIQPGRTTESVERLIAEVRRMIEAEDCLSFIKDLRSKVMSSDDQMVFARSAFRERIRNNPQEVTEANVEDLLVASCYEDRAPTLWGVLKRVHENLGLTFGKEAPVEIRYKYKVEGSETKRKERKLSSVTNIEEVIHLNQFLFDSMSQYVSQPERLEMQQAA